MGFLSKLFGRSREPDPSYVRAWAARRERQLRTCEDLSAEGLFAVMMWGLARFGRKDRRRRIPAELKRLGMDASERFSNDTALFELGCYLHFRVYLWLSENHPERRAEITTAFAREFEQLFSEALAAGDVQRLFEERLSGFGGLAVRGAELEEYHHHLSQLILLSKGNPHPQEYDFETAPVLVADVFEQTGVSIELASWEEAMLPALLESVREYCSLTG